MLVQSDVRGKNHRGNFVVEFGGLASDTTSRGSLKEGQHKPHAGLDSVLAQ